MKESTSAVLDFASEAGHVLLQNGAEIYRVEETMRRIASSYGVDDENFFILSNGIFATSESHAHVEFIPIKGSSIGKVVEVNQLSRDISQGKYTLEEARAELERIKSIPAKPVWEQLAAAFLGGFGFCAIFGGGYMDSLSSAICALLVQLFYIICATNLSKILGFVCSGTVGTALCILSHSLGFGNSLANMMVGALIPLIPGVPFTNGLRDIANEDYLAGVTKLLDAIMVFLSIALGVCIAFVVHSYFAGSMITVQGTLTDPQTAGVPFQLVSAFIGTSAFAVLFGCHRKHYLSTGVVGVAAWIVYLACFRLTVIGAVGSTFCAASVVNLLSRFFAKRMKCPGLVFRICGTFPLIPGVGVFWSAYYVVSNQMGLAMHTGFLAIKVTIAIILGIIVTNNIVHHKRFNTGFPWKNKK